MILADHQLRIEVASSWFQKAYKTKKRLTLRRKWPLYLGRLMVSSWSRPCRRMWHPQRNSSWTPSCRLLLRSDHPVTLIGGWLSIWTTPALNERCWLLKSWKEKEVERAYSAFIPRLASSDFFLWNALKGQFDGSTFESANGLAETIYENKCHPISETWSCFLEWEKRLQR
jgi:hypothetical protein